MTTDYEKMVERDRRFWRRGQIVWWLLVTLFIAALAIGFFVEITRGF